MVKTVTAKYDARSNTLQLIEPLEGVRDAENVKVTLSTAPDDHERPWLAFRGCLSGEAGEEFVRIIEEISPTQK